jgi:hypothetical protein
VEFMALLCPRSRPADLIDFTESARGQTALRSTP